MKFIKAHPSPRPSCSVVIPVFNSALTLPLLYRRLKAVLEGQRLKYELVFVDDASSDGSWQVLQQLRRSGRGRVKIARLTRNFGQHNALLCGFSHASGMSVVTIDDDLQHPPEEIPKLLKELRKGHDVVYGVFEKRRHSIVRNLQSALAKALIRVAIPGLSPYFNSFRALTLASARGVARMNTPFTFVDGSLSWIAGSIGQATVQAGRRLQGRSGYNLFKLLRYTLNILTTFSDLPLRLSMLTGLAAAVAGFLYAAFLIYRRLAHDDVSPGYTSVMACLLILGGLILVSQGINGEYIGRINHKTSGRPKYLEREEGPG